MFGAAQVFSDNLLYTWFAVVVSPLSCKMPLAADPEPILALMGASSAAGGTLLAWLLLH
jgi:hypothetical protein